MKMTPKGTGVRPQATAAPGLSPKEGGLKAGTKMGPSSNSGGAPPNVKTAKGGGNFKHPKATY